MRVYATVPVLAVALGLFAPGVAHAADDPAGAQALFNEAKKLVAAGKYAEACPKLEESQRLAPAVGTKFNLSDCYEHTGKLASAWAGFLSVAAASKNANQGQREKAARDRAAAIEPKLSRLAVGVPDAARVVGLEVRRDGEAIGEAEWGESMPVDPGEHTITATAPGKRPWKGIVEVTGAASLAKMLVPPLDDEPPPPAPVATEPSSASAAPAAAAPPPPSPPSKTLGWVLVGVGGAALVGGGVAWAMKSSTQSTLDGECGPTGQSCPPSASNDIANGKTYDALAVGLFALGGISAIAGVTYLVVAGKSPNASSALVVPVMSPGGGGAAVVGRF
jgi:hypothetical protein